MDTTTTTYQVTGQFIGGHPGNPRRYTLEHALQIVGLVCPAATRRGYTTTATAHHDRTEVRVLDTRGRTYRGVIVRPPLPDGALEPQGITTTSSDA